MLCQFSRPVIISLLFLAGCAQPKRGILLMAHGGDADWNDEVQAVVAPLRRQQPVEIALGMATTSTIREALARLEAQRVTDVAVVRLFVSPESFLAPTEYILGLRSDLPPDPNGNYLRPRSAPGCPEQHRVVTETVRAYSSPPGESHEHHCMEPPERVSSSLKIHLSHDGLADSHLVDQILVDRVRALSHNPPDESVLILGHGPGDDLENERWLAMMRARAVAVGQLGAFREIRCETLREDWPDRRRPAEQRIRQFVQAHSANGDRVIVIPFRVSGFGPYRDVLAGLDYVADGQGFCPHPNMTLWIADSAARCFARVQ